MLRTYIILVISAALSFAGCDEAPIDNRIDNDPVEVSGLVTANSNASADSTLGALQNALEAEEDIEIVKTINHATNAEAVGQTLPFTRVILFGNPKLGTPLMRQNQTAGIDLPQKLLVYQDANNEVTVAYNDPQYVVDRHGITGQDTVVTKISNALSMFAENAAGNPAILSDSTGTVDEGEGLVTVPSKNSVDVTYQNLVDAIENNGELSILAELDHQDNAATVGLELRPTRLLVFGNPNLGTPLLQDKQTIGIDLPQKMLVYEDASGSVFIVYNDPAYIAERHDIDGNSEQLDTISNALESLADTAAVQQ